MCFTLIVNLLIIVKPRHRPHNTIEHTQKKTLESSINAKCIVFTINGQVLIIKYSTTKQSTTL